MNTNAVRTELLKIAKMIQSWKIEDKQTRGQAYLPSEKKLAPTIAAHMRDLIYDGIEKNGYQTPKSSLKQEWSEYLTMTEGSHNKYHYYAIYSFGANGKKYYTGANVYGRIGEVGGGTDLTMKFAGGPVDSMQEAMKAVNKHMHSKIQKGYQPTTMV